MASPRTKGLGAGLDLLLGDQSLDFQDERMEVAISALQPGKYQPRTRMDPGALEELAASIRSQGLIQPILVRMVDGGRYEIIAGERRWRASQLAGLERVAVIVREVPDEAALAMSLIENIQREDLNPLEEAAGIQRLVDEFGLTHQQAADAVGRSRSAASNLLRLLQLAVPVQEMLMAGDLEMGHARALLPLEAGHQVAAAHRISAKKLSVREAEKLVSQALKESAGVAAPERDRDLVRLEEALADHLGASVRMRTNRKGAGQLTVSFGSLDELDGLLLRLGFNKEI